jgi:uncharacterized membrane protein
MTAQASQTAGSVRGPEVRSILVGDLLDCLKAGLQDFAAFPAYGLFFGLFYAVAGLGIIALALNTGNYVLVLPLVMGFALVGPFVALGLYEVSRRRENGLPLSFPIVLGVIRQSSGRQIIMLGFTLMVILLFWVRAALFIYALNFGLRPVNLVTMAMQTVTTPAGMTFLLTGAIVGAVFAALAFAISVFSFPHLVAQEDDFITAILLSVRGVLLNAPVMLIWGLIVGMLLLLAAIPFFLGLAVVLPVLGHATWHLYRKVIAADLTPAKVAKA